MSALYQNMNIKHLHTTIAYNIKFKTKSKFKTQPPRHVQTKPPRLHPHPNTHATTKANGVTSSAKNKKKNKK